MNWDALTKFEELRDNLNIVNNEIIDFIGQDAAKTQLSAFLEAEYYPNTLIMGDAGLGKTYLAKWIAGKCDQNVQIHRELPIKRKQLEDQFKFVILDEVHQQRHAEWLYPLMEDPSWTFIGTTNMPEKLPEAFKTRFIVQIRLRRYTVEEMQDMVKKANPEIGDQDAFVLGNAGGGNPRQLQRIIATAEALGNWDPSTVLATVRINADGISEDHLAYLECLEDFDRPIGVQYVASRLSIDVGTVRSLEQHLLDMGFITLEPNGRALTALGSGYTRLMRERGLLI